MEHFLKLIEGRSPQHQQEVSIDPEKLKFFTSQVKIWKYTRLNYKDCQNFSVEDRFSMLKSYYVDMFARFSNGSGTWLCFLFFVFCLSRCFMRFTHEFVVTRACFYEHSSLLLLRARHEFFSLHCHEVSCIFFRRIKL